MSLYTWLPAKENIGENDVRLHLDEVVERLKTIAMQRTFLSWQESWPAESARTWDRFDATGARL